ncbi:MAG: hypothetical protein KatS3mg097_164 [Candidatus Parcubacteria bacterium]|nr:MAG: hypothetical protein KatS3mg097_164 [Candidatus Parcubacteria bacterium]
MDKKSSKEILATYFLVFILIFVLVLSVINFVNTKQKSYLKFEPVNDGDWIKGDKKAKVIIVEYSDFQCPACANYYSLVRQLLEDYDLNADLAFVYRHFPLPFHKYAKLAARAAEAAGKQNKFWEMHNLLFERQKEWSLANNINVENVFKKYAQELQLDVNKFMFDLNSAEIMQKVDQAYMKALANNIQQTPTFFVNGKVINNPPNYNAFRKIILTELKANSSNIDKSLNSK